MNQTNKKYIYVFVRKDLPIEQILVQSSHAAYEAGLAFDNQSKLITSVLVIGVKNKSALEKAYLQLSSSIELVKFEEPSWDYGFTAFATQPISNEQRILLKKYQLFKHIAKEAV